jgi:hypothetical protein
MATLPRRAGIIKNVESDRKDLAIAGTGSKYDSIPAIIMHKNMHVST